MMYQFTDDMAEISGFGGGYEDTCRRMVVAGLEWLGAHPDADPQFHGYKNVYGLCMEDNEDAKALTKAMTAPPNNDCTGAMHQATVSHALWIHRHSWQEYVDYMRSHTRPQPAT